MERETKITWMMGENDNDELKEGFNGVLLLPTTGEGWDEKQSSPSPHWGEGWDEGLLFRLELDCHLSSLNHLTSHDSPSPRPSPHRGEGDPETPALACRFAFSCVHGSDC